MRALHALRGTFDPTAKVRLLHAVRRLPCSSPGQLLELHDELLFLAAFPDSLRIARLANDALHAFHLRARQLSHAARRRLGDTGIVGTTSAHTYMFGVAQWLARTGQRLEIEWESFARPDTLDPLIRQTMLPAEADAFDSGSYTTRQWIELASAQCGTGPLGWLIAAGPGTNSAIARVLYDRAEVPLQWHLNDSPWSVTRNRAPVERVVARNAFRRLPPDVVALIGTPLPHIRRLVGEAASRPWVDACIAALAARCREVDPTVYANPHEVYVADLGAGVSLCVIGAAVEDRLALESNYGYVLFANGVPIGYGGVTPLANQANTGANLFEAFRHSEAAFIYAQCLRAFRTLFGISRFVVNPYQFGADNDEALQSGAFWFYHRLGFRPVDAAVADIARRELRRLKVRPGARTSLRTLRTLATSDLVLEIDPTSPVPRFEERALARLGSRVAGRLSAVPAAQRATYLERRASELKLALAGSPAALTIAEQRGAHLLVPYIELFAERLPQWSQGERRALWALLQAKGARQERAFARASRAHLPFWRELARLGA